jgi:hypothetical protein
MTVRETIEKAIKGHCGRSAERAATHLRSSSGLGYMAVFQMFQAVAEDVGVPYGLPEHDQLMQEADHTGRSGGGY